MQEIALFLSSIAGVATAAFIGIAIAQNLPIAPIAYVIGKNLAINVGLNFAREIIGKIPLMSTTLLLPLDIAVICLSGASFIKFPTL